MPKNLPDATASTYPFAPENRNESSHADPVACVGGPWDDPGWLLENYFRGHHWTADSAATLMLSWLSILPQEIAPPSAARSLLKRFTPKTESRLPSHKRDLLDMLAFVANHQRQPNSAEMN